jgi:glucosyl-dolichyl phosphate glucuronosyltransferase
MMLSVSILIPTHNRSGVLARLLTSLRTMRVPARQPVELVVVANACTDDTQTVVASMAASMPFPTRCVAEARPSSSLARNVAVQQSSGDILAFLDDDVSVVPGWLEGLLHVYDAEAASLVAGKVTLGWEVDRPAWLNNKLDGLLMYRDHGDAVKELSDPGAALGANLSCRREVYECVGGMRVDLGRIGKVQMGSVEDGDFVRRAMKRGYRMYYAPGAAVEHWVPPHRATCEYLCKVAYGTAMTGQMMKEHFSLPAAGRSLLYHVTLVCLHAAGLATGTITRNVELANFSRVRGAWARGAVAGALNRIRSGHL